MGKSKGTPFGLYLSDEEPTAGTEGDISSYDLVGFDKDLTRTGAKDMIDMSDKQTGSDSEYTPGRRDQTIDLTCNSDVEHDSDAGQEHAHSSYNGDTEAESLLYFLITDNVTGHTQYYGQCFVSQLDESYPDEDVIELSLSLQVTGAVTRQAVAT